MPSLTTVHAPLEELVRLAVEAITAGEWADPPALPVQVQVLLRDSTPQRTA